MKTYFPFTDYDFYAYLTSGVLTLSVVDFAFNGVGFLTRSDWNFVQIVAAVSAAYVVGHIIATLAQLVIETFALSYLFSKPIALQLGFKKPNILERLMGVLVGRYYTPLESSIQRKILDEAKTALSKDLEDPISAEDVFQVGFKRSFTVDGARVRIDSFLNQYGFCRNIAFVALLSVGLLGWQSYFSDFLYESQLLLISIIVFIGMFIRFVKFLASFQAEVIRCLLK
ncbi:MAG: hypothetical protein L3J37_00035 [Rhodobacteraceae bacterium]|nr:hypothetical protein [Paracoccaceae bacterium]